MLFAMRKKRKTNVLIIFTVVIFAVYFIYKGFFQPSHDVSDDKNLTTERKTTKPPIVLPPECHQTTLRQENISYRDAACVIRVPSSKACKTANKYFGSPSQDLGKRTCPTTPASDICWFNDKQPPKLQCSMSVCANSRVYMTRQDKKTGTIENWRDIYPFTTENAEKFVQETRENGENFCLIKCENVPELQVIILPPRLILKTNMHGKPNVIIILLDSISRRHFYRVLRKSVQAFKDVMSDPSVAATVFDFELFQSISMHTFDNLRPFFSGVLHGDTNFNKQSSAAQRPLGMDVMFKHFREHGYQTVMQEDLCWYDEWGVVLDDLERKPDSIPSVERWERFLKVISKHQLDHVGITHFTCEALKPYKMTNLYDTPPKVCFNGRFISSYFYKYIGSYVKVVRRTRNAAPIILYQHFNTAHTETGTRIINMDEDLASFIHLVARDPNTWTLIFSDHGHTRTDFGLTEDGLLERYNPLLFMIVPHKLSKLLGKETMDTLSTNQQRLITTLDLHKALMTFHQRSNTRSKDFRKSGVFSEIPSNRTCSDLPLMPLARCQCDGTDEKLKDNSPSHTWLAEFALGSLNGFIQKQFSQGNHSKSVGIKGFGRCGRLTGKSFTKVVQSNDGSLVRFNIHVDATSVGLHEDEVFQVAVKVKDGNPSMVLYDRQTMYNKFKDCADEAVELKLCVCDKRKFLSNKFVTINSKDNLNPKLHTMFHSNANITSLYKDCLYQVTRRHPSGQSVVYEVINICQDKTFKVAVKGSTYYVFLSRTLPMEFTVEPNGFYFMFSGARQILGHSHLDITVSATVVT